MSTVLCAHDRYLRLLSMRDEVSCPVSPEFLRLSEELDALWFQLTKEEQQSVERTQKK